MNKKILIIIFVISIIVLGLIFIYKNNKKPVNIDNEKSEKNNINNEEIVAMNIIKVTINNQTLDIKLENNSSANAFFEKLKVNDVIVDTHDYGNFEKVGNLGFELPTNDEKITTEAGDLILYQGNQVTLYYDTNTWNFTKLGRIQNVSQEELKQILGKGDVTMTFSLSSENRTSFNFNTKTVQLNNGYTMPILGLGTWTLTNEQAEECVYEAIKDGYRLIDTAQYYGDEVGVGKGVRKAISEGIVKREDVFVTSKIYASTDHNAAIEKTLNNLDIEYVDLLLIHQPGFDDKGLYQAMENYYKQGKLKAIGISNYYTKEAVDEVLSYAEIMPSIIQNENHIYYQNTELQEYVKQYGIIIESWYPFGGRGHTSENFNNEVIKELAEKYNKTSAQIILRWQLQAGYIAIPGSKNPDHIKENISIFDFELSDEDMKKIYNINENRRYENW